MLLHLMYLVKPQFCVFAQFMQFVCAGVKAVNQAVVQTEQQHQPTIKHTLILSVMWQKGGSITGLCDSRYKILAWIQKLNYKLLRELF